MSDKIIWLDEKYHIEENNKSYDIIGISILKNNNYIYIITSSNTSTSNNIIYISIEVSEPIFWYEFVNKEIFLEKFDELYNIYNNEYDSDFTRASRAYIGMNLNVTELEKYFIISDNTDGLLWGSQWQDYPFRNLITSNNTQFRENILYTLLASKQIDNTYHINIRTKYSKSIITIEIYDNIFIVNIQYNSILTSQIDYINNMTNDKEYENDMPIDIIMLLINFPYKTLNNLFDMDLFNNDSLLIISLLANNKKMYQETLNKIEKYNINIQENEYLKHLVSKFEIYIRIENILAISEIKKHICENIIILTEDLNNYISIKEAINEKIYDYLDETELNDTELIEHIDNIVKNIIIHNMK